MEAAGRGAGRVGVDGPRLGEWDASANPRASGSAGSVSRMESGGGAVGRIDSLLALLLTELIVPVFPRALRYWEGT